MVVLGQRVADLGAGHMAQLAPERSPRVDPAQAAVAAHDGKPRLRAMVAGQRMVVDRAVVAGIAAQGLQRAVGLVALGQAVKELVRDRAGVPLRHAARPEGHGVERDDVDVCGRGGEEGLHRIVAHVDVHEFVHVEHHQPVGRVDVEAVAEACVAFRLRHLAGGNAVTQEVDVGGRLEGRQKPDRSVVAVVRGNEDAVEAEREVMGHEFEEERPLVADAGEKVDGRVWHGSGSGGPVAALCRGWGDGCNRGWR